MSKNFKNRDELHWYMKHLPKEDILTDTEEKEVHKRLMQVRKESVLQCYPSLSEGFHDYFSGFFPKYSVPADVSQKYLTLEKRLAEPADSSQCQKPEQRVYKFFQRINNWSYLRNILYLHKDASPADIFYADLLTIEHTLFASSSRFAVKFAYRKGNSSVPLADRVQDANLGLLRALDTFNPEKGFRFLTYARWWIRSSLQRSPSKEGFFHLPPDLRRALPNLLQMDWENHHRSLPYTAEQKRQKLHLSKEGFQHLRTAPNFLNPSSLEERVGKNKDSLSPLPNSLILSDPSAEEGFQEIERKEEQQKVHEWFKKAIAAEILNKREVKILQLRFGFSKKARLEEGEGDSLQIIGDMLNLSRERVRQIQGRALKKLRSSKLADELRELIE